jgi:hypothetical protein
LGDWGNLLEASEKVRAFARYELAGDVLALVENLIHDVGMHGTLATRAAIAAWIIAVLRVGRTMRGGTPSSA